MKSFAALAAVTMLISNTQQTEREYQQLNKIGRGYSKTPLTGKQRKIRKKNKVARQQRKRK